ncbi:hypothetical protein SAMN05216167_11277 [Spirosoma endophyticum]|uniref:Uncharacterized protein n=2 Tax=Spirosoma endophyticum TaxID=662367 RepID=A0A1I1ZC00_9BACT|nr:hypothetical protein SAMN05216167_11277 [Spirosoma endophyticum]
MNDPYFIKMLDFVKDDLSTYNAETHFLILRVTPSSLKRSIAHSIRLKREYGIQTIFFQDEDGKYTGISQFIAELENQVNVVVKKVEPVKNATAVEVTAVAQGDVALTERLFSLSREQYADED